MAARDTPDMPLETVVSTLTEYYELLVRMYIPQPALKYPPAGGWPNITEETTRGFNKSRHVIALMKQLPYIDDKDTREMKTNIHYKSDVIDYSTWTPEKFASESEPLGEIALRQRKEDLEAERQTEQNNEDDEEGKDDESVEFADEDEDDAEAKDQDRNQDQSQDQEQDDQEADGSDEEDSQSLDPWEDIRLENMLVIADGYESGGRAMILDVMSGGLWEDMIRYDLNLENFVDYFDTLTAKLWRLEYVPVPGHEFFENVPDGTKHPNGFPNDPDSNITIEIQKIYRDHGWPGEDYDKEVALAAVEAHWQRWEEKQDW